MINTYYNSVDYIMYTGRTLENKNHEIVVLYLFIRILYGVIRFTCQDTRTKSENNII